MEKVHPFLHLYPRWDSGYALYCPSVHLRKRMFASSGEHKTEREEVREVLALFWKEVFREHSL